MRNAFSVSASWPERFKTGTARMTPEQEKLSREKPEPEGRGGFSDRAMGESSCMDLRPAFPEKREHGLLRPREQTDLGTTQAELEPSVF